MNAGEHVSFSKLTNKISIYDEVKVRINEKNKYLHPDV